MIVGTFNKIPKKSNSHSYGWARTWSENLGVSIDHENNVHNKVYLLHGANFGGALNLFGGFTEELKKSIDNLMLAEEIVSLDIPMPDYGALLKNRKDVIDKEWCDRISDKLSNCKTLLSSDLELDWLAIGDSHTAAYSRLNSSVIKRDGTTLNSQVNSSFDYLKSHIKKRSWNGITISLGNIDVRFHINRLSVDWKLMYDKLFSFGDTLGCEVEYCLPWPIEYEERKLPKSGQYKGQNFYSSRSERLDLVMNIYSYMKNKSVNIVTCPMDWYTMDPKKYAESHMEGNQSVHLSPESYRRANWGKKDASLDDFFA